MKLFITILLSLAPTLTFAATSCPHCDDLRDFRSKCERLEAKTPGPKTDAEQMRLAGVGSAVIGSALKDPNLSAEAAELMLPLMIKVMNYDNTEDSLENMHCSSFKKQWARTTGNVLKAAMEKDLSLPAGAANKLSSDDKNNILGSCDLYRGPSSEKKVDAKTPAKPELMQDGNGGESEDQE